MTEQRFRREGMGWRFAPAEVQAVLHFSHHEKTTFEVAVFRRDGRRSFTRRVDVVSSPIRGGLKELIDELDSYINGPDWRGLLREACESVLAAHRAGPPIEVIEGAIERPPPPAWLCEGLLLKDKPNIWLGAGSTGKSTLAKAICAYYAAGYRFLDRPMEQGVPCYLDWEDDKLGFQRTVYDVCRNLGVWPLPKMLWRDMHGRRLRDQIEELARTVDREKVGLIVLDAVAAASGSPGEHMSWEAVALELEMALGCLPPVTVLALDHVTSSDHKDNLYVPVKARGAERKYEFTRNQWTLMADHEARESNRHLVVWHHTKFNAGLLEKPFITELIHREAELSIVVRALESSAEAMDRLTDMQKILRWLMTTQGQLASDICQGVYGFTNKTKVDAVRVNLRRASDKGLVWEDDAHRWWAKTLTTDNLITFPGGPA